MSAPLSLLLHLLLLAPLPACDLTVPPLDPTLILRCAHPDLWFEGIFPCPDGTCGFPADHPYRPTALVTQIPAAAWTGPTGAAAQDACADVCVGTAQAGFFHRCPNAGWEVDAEPVLAPAPPEFAPHIAALVDPDACFPDALCTAAFAAPPGARLRAPAGTRAGPADHLGALTAATLDLELAGARLAHPLQGRAEYSAGACEAARCPFYLASLTLDGHPRPASLQGLQVELQRPALGIHSPTTGALEFPVGALDLQLRLDLSVGVAITTRELRLRNPVAIHGRFRAGTLQLELELPLPGGHARLDLEFTPLAHPPIAAFDPPARLNAGPGGLLLPQDPGEPSRLHAAHDPDGDLARLHWVVDGVPGARHLDPGEHEVALWVADRRGALARSPARTLVVTAAP